MASSGDPELKGGFSLPAWMKNKPAGVRELEPFSSSPPPHDDSFFYIRYPKPESLLPKTKMEQNLSSIIKQENLTITSGSQDKDWSKHTKPCQDVIKGISPIGAASSSVAVKPKPLGTDDGFKGEGAACGSSIVKVAHQMISSSSRSGSQRGFAVASPSDDTFDSDSVDLGNYNLNKRRGSKSLPSSPNSRRKNAGNRYFSSPFEPSDASSGRSWLTAALLGYKKELRDSASTLAEEDYAVESRLQGHSIAASVENLGPGHRSASMEPQTSVTAVPVSQEPKLNKPAANFRPKPSELREMNFWSPTSM